MNNLNQSEPMRAPKRRLSLLPVLFLFLISSTVSIAADTVRYSYDVLDRLTDVEYVGKGAIHFLYDKAGSIVNLTILVTGSTIVDTDEDGIADEWEMYYFKTLTAASAISDGDHDGYADIWEYINWNQGLVDGSNTTFDPLVLNAPGSQGYSPHVTSGEFWIKVMPAILGNSEK